MKNIIIVEVSEKNVLSLQCFFLFQKMPPHPLNLYVGVEHVAAHSTALTAAILRWFTGDIVGDADVNCTNVPRNFVSNYH